MGGTRGAVLPPADAQISATDRWGTMTPGGTRMAGCRTWEREPRLAGILSCLDLAHCPTLATSTLETAARLDIH